MKVIGKIIQDIRKKYSSLEEYKAFAVGFAAGQAEKVYLGACNAAMFRPANEHFSWHYGEVTNLASKYGLNVTVLESHCPATVYEIWLHRKPIGEWLGHEVNSKEWHVLRAKECGIADIDTEYHMREGYGERCD